MIPWDFKEGTKLWWRNSYWLQYSCLNQLLSSFQQPLHYCAVFTGIRWKVHTSWCISQWMDPMELWTRWNNLMVRSILDSWFAAFIMSGSTTPQSLFQQLLDCCAAFPTIHWKFHTFWGIIQWMDPICSFRQIQHFDGVIHVCFFWFSAFMSGSTPKVICCSCLS